jgi:NADPH2:quinone reductase
MRVVVGERQGGPEVLSVTEREEPRPGPGEVVVDVAAAGVNFMDIYQREGIGSYRTDPPFVPGGEGAGTVVAVGADVKHFASGDRVAWANLPESYAEQVALPAHRVVKIPEGISLQTAAAAMLQGMTAHYLCTSTYPVREGDITVVHAAAGGVGLLLTQMVKRRGGVIVATTSGGPDGGKVELALRAGADHVVGYDRFRDIVDEASDGAGAHVVYDGVGQATFDDSLAALRPRGMMVLYGAASGQVPPVDPQRLNTGGSLFLTRPTLTHYIADADEQRWRAGEVFDWILKGDLEVRIGGTYPLAEAAKAQQDLASRRTTGKLLLLPGV